MFGFGDNGWKDRGRYFDPSWLDMSTDNNDEEEQSFEADLHPATAGETLGIEQGVVDDSAQLAQRVRSDFTNYKRRIEQEKEKQVKCANKSLILKLLPVLDDFNYAQDSAPHDMAEKDWVKGVSLIKEKLMSILEKEGVSKINVKGTLFDPRQHEAIFCDDTASDDKCRVKEVIKDGYKLGGDVIRPAQVIVSS